MLLSNQTYAKREQANRIGSHLNFCSYYIQSKVYSCNLCYDNNTLILLNSTSF